MNLAKTERDYPNGGYWHKECKWCGFSYIGPKHENACKKCDDTLQRMGGFGSLFNQGAENKVKDNVNNPLENMKKWMEVIPQCLQTESQKTFEDEVVSLELEMTKKEFVKRGFLPPEFKSESEKRSWLEAVVELDRIDKKLNRAQKQVERLEESRREHINRHNLNRK